MNKIINNKAGAVALMIWNEKRRTFEFDCEADNYEEYRQLLAVQRHYEREGKLTQIVGAL